jgi:hypothetical protein
MSTNSLNDISKIYLEQVAVSEAKVDKLKPEHERATARDKRSEFSDLPGSGARRARRIAHRERDEMRKDAKDIRRGRLDAPQFQGKTGQERITQVKKVMGMKEEKKPNDGNLANNYPPYDKVTRGDVIAGRLGKDEMGGKKKVTKEGYSNWRQDLSEVLGNVKDDKKIAEKKINNKITINPKLDLGEAIENLGGSLVEMVELDEEFIYETANIATEYFYEMGLNEFGIGILIEELGLEGFVDFVFELSEEYTLTEARRSGKIEPVTAKGTAFKSGKPTGKSLQRLRAQKAARKEAEAKASSSKPSGMKAALQRQSAVASAKKQQPTKKPIKDRIAKGVLSALDAYQKGMERHRAATATAGKALRVAGKGASEFGRGVASGVKTVGKVAKDVRRVVGESEEIDEAKVESGESEATKKDIRSRRYVEKTKGAEGVRNYDAMGSTAPNWVTAARRRAHKAERGIKREEFELDEKTLSTAETKKKEEIVKSMKDKAADFEKRYPGRGKEVMYATATKMAKKMSEQAMELQPKSQQSSQPQKSDQQQKKLQQQQDRMRQQEVQILQRKLQTLRSAPKGSDPSIMAGYEPEGGMVDEARSSEKRGLGSPESPLSYPGRTVQKQRGERGGRHQYSGSVEYGGAAAERGKKKSDPYSQAQRLRKLSNYPEITGKYSGMQSKKRDIGSRFD